MGLRSSLERHVKSVGGLRTENLVAIARILFKLTWIEMKGCGLEEVK